MLYSDDKLSKIKTYKNLKLLVAVIVELPVKFHFLEFLFNSEFPSLTFYDLGSTWFFLLLSSVSVLPSSWSFPQAKAFSANFLLLAVFTFIAAL